MSPRKPRSTMDAPAEPARSTGLPLGSWRKCVPACVLTSNSGVPWSKVKVKVSPAATADTIGGVVLVLESAVDQLGDAAPAAVHANGEGRGVGVTCELPAPVEPHAASSMTVARRAATLIG